MKKSLLITAIVLLTQANSAFAAGSSGYTLGKINQRETQILAPAKTSLDALSKEIKEASDKDKATVGRRLLSIPSVKAGIQSLATNLGLPQTMTNVVSVMPHSLRSMLFIEVTREQTATDPKIAQSPKGKLADALHSVFSKMSDKIGLNSAKEVEALNNLFENAPGLGETLLPFLESLSMEFDRGSDLKKAMTNSAEPLRQKYNAKNKDKAPVKIEDFIEMLKKCTSLPG